MLLRIFAAIWLLLSVLLARADTRKMHASTSEGKEFIYEVFDAGPDSPVLILLHGSSGPTTALYQDQAARFAKLGYTVLLPHYFEATRSTAPTTANYKAWIGVVRSLVADYGSQSTSERSRSVELLGFSLGASIALAAGSEGVKLRAVAEWYGSLPDDFFYQLQGMPPLLILHGSRDSNIPVNNALQLIRLCVLKGFTCESHLYPDQGHGFEGGALEDADVRTQSFLERFRRVAAFHEP